MVRDVLPQHLLLVFRAQDLIRRHAKVFAVRGGQVPQIVCVDGPADEAFARPVGPAASDDLVFAAQPTVNRFQLLRRQRRQVLLDLRVGEPPLRFLQQLGQVAYLLRLGRR